MQDKLVSVTRFANGVLVSFNYVMASAIPERRMAFHCSEGTLKVDLYRAEIVWRTFADPAETTLHFTGSDLHGGGDDVIGREVYESMVQKCAPKCSGAEGLRSAVYALAIDQAARENRIVQLSDVWQKLGIQIR